MKLLKNILNKIKVIFQSKDEEGEKAEPIFENINKENEDIEDKLNEVHTSRLENLLNQYENKKKIILLKDITANLENIEINSLIYYIQDYSLLMSEVREFFWLNLYNEYLDENLKLCIDVMNDKKILIYEQEYTVGRNTEIEFFSSEYIKKTLLEKKIDFNFEKLKRYFIKELDKKYIIDIYYDEIGNFYFKLKRDKYITSKYIRNENYIDKTIKYFQVNFQKIKPIKQLIDLNLDEIINIEVYEEMNKDKRIIFLNRKKKTYIQFIYEIQQNDIMII